MGNAYNNKAIVTGGKRTVLVNSAIAAELAKDARFAGKCPDRKDYADYAHAVDALRVAAYKLYLRHATIDDVYTALKAVLAMVGKVTGKNLSADEPLLTVDGNTTLFYDAVRYAVRDKRIITSTKLADAIAAQKQAKKALDNANAETLDACREAKAAADAEVERLLGLPDNAHMGVTFASASTFYKKFSVALSNAIAGRSAEDYDAAVAAAAKADEERKERNAAKKAARKQNAKKAA